MEAEHQVFESEKQGRPIYKEVPYLTLHFPADRTKKIHRKVKMEDDALSPSDPHRFPKQWAAFVEQREQVPDGTPVEQWPPLNRARVMELKAMHIHTVEQIAALSDQTGPNIGLDWRKLRDLATSFLDESKAVSKVSALMQENTDLKTRLEIMERQVQALASGGSAEPTAPKKRGRKPKIQGDEE